LRGEVLGGTNILIAEGYDKTITSARVRKKARSGPERQASLLPLAPKYKKKKRG